MIPIQGLGLLYVMVIYIVGKCRHRFKPDTFVCDMSYDIRRIF